MRKSNIHVWIMWNISQNYWIYLLCPINCILEIDWVLNDFSGCKWLNECNNLGGFFLLFSSFSFFFFLSNSWKFCALCRTNSRSATHSFRQFEIIFVSRENPNRKFRKFWNFSNLSTIFEFLKILRPVGKRCNSSFRPLPFLPRVHICGRFSIIYNNFKLFSTLFDNFLTFSKVWQIWYLLKAPQSARTLPSFQLEMWNFR